MCGTSLPVVAASAAGGAAAGWACAVCTYVNESGAVTCDVCATPRGSGDAPDPLCETCGVADANPPFASCCRECALGQRCLCTPKKRSVVSPAGAPSAAPKKRSVTSPAGAPSAAPGEPGETLTSTETFDLLAAAGALARRPPSGADTEAELLRILGRLHRHVVADRAADRAALADAGFLWEWQAAGLAAPRGQRGGGGGAGGWTALSSADQLTVEAERRGGKGVAALTSSTGERVDLNLTAGTATFTISRKTVGLRAVPKAPPEPVASSSSSAVSSSVPSSASSECQICYSAAPVVIEGCGHRSACADCVAGHAAARGGAGSADVAAWVPCPAVGCEEPLGPRHLMSLGSGFPVAWLSKQLVRLPEWAPCASASSRAAPCPGGVLVTRANEGSTAPCPVCAAGVLCARRAEAEDPAVAKMVADGTVRHCPGCRFPTLKEFGVCNIICCEQCGGWWNWRTGELGTSSKQLKDRARQRGTLWEPGELAFQQTLQQSDPAAFKALLERNGVKFNPHYQRGS